MNSRAQAKKEGKTRYFGSVCFDHPELNGERMVSNFACVSCKNQKHHRQAKAKYHNDEKYKERYLIRRSELKAKWNRYGFYAANYRAAQKQRTPKWANHSAIKEIYKEAKKLNMTVDHYYPLCGETVSGLHVENNLRVIPQKENDMKSNKHPDEFYGNI